MSVKKFFLIEVRINKEFRIILKKRWLVVWVSLEVKMKVSIVFAVVLGNSSRRAFALCRGGALR